MFDTTQSYCTWEESAETGTCVYQEAVFTWEVILVLEIECVSKWIANNLVAATIVDLGGCSSCYGCCHIHCFPQYTY